MTPSLLRLILSVMLFIMFGLGVGLAIVANGKLSAVADETSESLVSAQASEGNLKGLQAIEEKLEEQKLSVKRAQDIVGLSAGYTYQDQVIRDLNAYAKRSSVKIQNIDFAGSDSTAGAGAPASGGSAAPATPATPDATAGGAGTATPTPATSSIKASTVTITLASGTKYTDLLTFFNMIEQSLPKLQILSVGLTKAGEGDGVDSQALQIDVYIR